MSLEAVPETLLEIETNIVFINMALINTASMEIFYLKQ